jgi:hypothetical protein
MAASCCILHDMEIRTSICVSGVARIVCPGPRTIGGGDLSCEVEACRARRRLVVRGGDLSCEVETFRARRRLSSSGELVGDATNWPKTRRLASVGLDQGSFSSLP